MSTKAIIICDHCGAEYTYDFKTQDDAKGNGLCSQSCLREFLTEQGECHLEAAPAQWDR